MSNAPAPPPTGSRIPAWITTRRSWLIPAAAAVAASGLTLAIAASYYSPLIGEWENHAASIATERDQAQETADDVEQQLDIVTTDRDEYRDSVESSEERAVAAETRIAEVEQREAAVTLAEGGLAEREAAVAGAEQQISDNTIREGRWTVGVDVAPGFYRVTTPVTGDRCYWAITATGSNGDDILSNDYGTAGNLSVTLREGQDFETSRCGSWTLQP